MPEVGLEGQLKLKRARVLLIGTGGLGAPLGLYLAAAGVGHLGLVDFDVVDFSNLQRQVTFATGDVGKHKTEAAKARLSGLNPTIEIETFETRLTSENALELFRDFDIIVDGTDNFPTRFLVNDACLLLGKPNVYGSIFRFEGQAMETIKLILGTGEPLVGRLLLFDALAMRFRELKLRKNPACPLCGEHRTITKLIDYEEFCGIRGEEAPPMTNGIPEITPKDLKARQDRGDDLFILDVREPHEYQICNLNGKLIPLGELPRRVSELDSSREMVVHCRSGKRSADAIQFLQKAGFKKLLNLKGGVLAWADEVDPTMPKY